MNGGDNGPHEGPTIGRTLELARKQRGLSLKQVEEATKIRTGYLRDLERENFDVLPAVYVQGSLRTYANFLGLDGDAMVRELKGRQGSDEETTYPLYVGPREEDSLDDILAAAGGGAAAKSGTTSEEDEDAERAFLPAGVSGYLYLASALFTILVVAAVVLALNAAGDRRTEVSQVHEPLISRAPEATPPRAREETQQPPQDAEKSAGAERTEPEKPSASKAEDEQTKEEGSGVARSSASATATATASAPAEQEVKSTPVASKEPSRKDSAAPEPLASGEAPSSPRPTAQPGAAPPGGANDRPQRGGGRIKVRVVVGGKDPVKLSGGPFGD